MHTYINVRNSLQVICVHCTCNCIQYKCWPVSPWFCLSIKDLDRVLGTVWIKPRDVEKITFFFKGMYFVLKCGVKFVLLKIFIVISENAWKCELYHVNINIILYIGSDIYCHQLYCILLFIAAIKWKNHSPVCVVCFSCENANMPLFTTGNDGGHVF